MTKVSTYLFFEGYCEEAMKFYRDCLGGELTLIRVSDTPVKDDFPENLRDKIMHASLSGSLVDILASDWLTADPEMSRGNSVKIVISDAPVEELSGYFDKLALNAQKIEPLAKQFFGTYGSLVDRYGIGWMFVANDVA